MLTTRRLPEGICHQSGILRTVREVSEPRLSISVHLFVVTTLLVLSLVALVAATASRRWVDGESKAARQYHVYKCQCSLSQSIIDYEEELISGLLVRPASETL